MSVPAHRFLRYEQLRVRFRDDRQDHDGECAGRQGAEAVHDDGVEPCAPSFRGVGSPEIVAGNRVPEVATDSPDDSADKDIPQKHFLILI